MKHPRWTKLLLLAGWMLLTVGCGTPPKVVRQDPEIERNVVLARSAFAAGSAEKAVTYYQKALNRARLMDDPAAIGRNAYNLAACLALLCQDDEARALLDEAHAEFQRTGITAREIPLLKARLDCRDGNTAEALALVQSQLKAATPKDKFFLQYQILLADLLCARGDAKGAALELSRVNLKALNAEEPVVQADAAQVRARIALLDQKSREAGEFLDAAAKHLQQAGQYIEMAVALDEAGRAYETAGDRNAAMNRYYRAARSLFLAGQTARAERVMIRAVLLADQSGQAEMRKKIQQLQADMNAARKSVVQEQ
ncbi:MAG: hypothetical protein KKG09_04880 [Verrucomicrobia bacterium]|nr:hypothetical protein [Verrucomicrobiota bacterium]MCG2680251.1 hypothetical protein [Kiritimatiellia bacterium]MBU4248547.1 hypothetical protein [Verrucomicrobiota bacterium]MBU4289784.1 hypothetical protein [Verrucomicrobiota bacterium]MBU4429592.1 hypothetical protein [Verrucomicrobiota bacterium]